MTKNWFIDGDHMPLPGKAGTPAVIRYDYERDLWFVERENVTYQRAGDLSGSWQLAGPYAGTP